MADKKVVNKKESGLVPLQELIDLVDKFMNGEITKEEMAEYGSNMTIRAYMPMMDKLATAIAISTRYVYSTAEIHEVKVAEMYKDLFFNALLTGYGYIDCSNTKLTTFDTYDKLYPIFAPFLLSYCENDYNLFKEYLHDSIESYGIGSLVEAVSGISEDALKEATKENRRMLSELGANKELIHELKEIAAMNNPLTKKVVDELRAISIEKTEQEEKS